MRLLLILVLALQPLVYAQTVQEQRPLRVGIAGLTHGHVDWILRAASKGDVELAGVSESNRDLAERLLKQYNLSMDLLYPDIHQMLANAKPEAVTAFGSIYEHLEVVRACAPKKIHVMVEKPLAVSLTHAREMEALALAHNIHLLTNYETTWYGSNHAVFRMVHQENKFGEIVKVVVHDGHQGPKEIGVSDEFLAWLTDPRLNGGGALMDFGCYGADLVTWLMKGQRPLSVSAITQQIKPDIYPRVDDEATIIVTYPKAQAIIQASWNWPYNRKDMEVYGKTGYVVADSQGIRYLADPNEGEQKQRIGHRAAPYNDPFIFLAALIRGKITIDDNDLSSLPVNMIAMEILEAAKRSAKEKKVIFLQKK
jgi:predicted dehydrogenase